MATLPDRDPLTTPADGDLYMTTDVSDTSDHANGTDKKITWSNIKAALKTYFDTLYAAVSHTHTASDVTDFDTEVANNSAVTANTAKNSYPSADSTKLAGIAAGAEVNPDVVSQAEAEAGTANTERTWTAQRVAQAIAALSVSEVLDDTTPQLGGDLDNNGKNQTDVQALFFDGLPDTDHTATGNVTDSFNAGETVTAFAAVSMKSDGEWHYADADETGTVDRTFIGVSLEAGTDGNPLEVATHGSYVRDDSWTWTIASPIYVGTTAGQLTQTAPSATDDEVRVIGYAVSATVMRVEPSVAIVHA